MISATGKKLTGLKRGFKLEQLLLFGAGKIGRSFIGQLFSRGGYEVTFVDIDEKIIRALNRKNEYTLVIKSDAGEEVMNINHVKGLLPDQTDEIHELISSLNLMATAVGSSNLPGVIALMAEGIKYRIRNGNLSPVDIIIAENLRDAGRYFQKEFEKYLDQKLIHNKIGLIETSIGKMVPIMTENDIQDDILKVYAEPYNTLILDGKGFKNPMPGIQGLAPKNNIKAWVDRKSFIHNLGHAATVYYGYLKHPEKVYLYELLEDDEIQNFARESMRQSAQILMAKYPDDFTWESLSDHIEDLLLRFRNEALGDTIFRVGRDLYRKLGPKDRLAGAIRLGMSTNMPFDKILYALICGFYFRAKNDKGKLYPADQKFAREFKKDGVETSLQKVCNFDPLKHPEIFLKSSEIDRKISNQIKS